MTKLETSVIEWIRSVSPDAKLSADSDLVKTQTLDSLQIMDLVMHLETENGIAIPLDALTEANFKTPAAIASMVDQIKAGN